MVHSRTLTQEAELNKAIIMLLAIHLLTGCSTLTPVDPVTPVEKMSTYQLQNEYLELEHKINEQENEFNNIGISPRLNTNFQFNDSSGILIAVALNVLNAYNMDNMVTKIERNKSRLYEIERELSRRGMY